MEWLVYAAAIIGLCVPAYGLPTLIAGYRCHNNANAIGALNLFLGWTFIGWVAALIWSLTDNVQG